MDVVVAAAAAVFVFETGVEVIEYPVVKVLGDAVQLTVAVEWGPADVQVAEADAGRCRVLLV